MTVPGCSVLASRSRVKSSVFDVHGKTMSLKEHVEEFMMFYPSFFAPQKPSNTYKFTTRTTTTATPRPTTTLGRLFGRCQARGGLRLTQTNLIPYFRLGPDFGILPSIAFGMGLLGQSPKSNLPTVTRFVTF